ncbi:MAG: hypothetical protein AAGJ29_10215 [Pseudomonadota bacterium]
MLGILVAIRNFLLAVILAWLGMELPAQDPQQDQATAPESSVSFGAR